MFPVLPPNHSIRTTPQQVEIYQYDASPIAGREPVLLVHGLKDEYVAGFHWQRVCRYLTASSEFQKRCKIYLARYNTHARANVEMQAFRPAIRQLASLDGHPVVIVALSIGGNLVRSAIADRSTNTSVARLITLGAPFHGSPLFSKNWMQYSLLKNHKSPLIRLDRCLAYRIYFRTHNNLPPDYYWDNCDSRVPSIGQYRFRFPVLAKGKLAPPTVPPPADSCTAGDSKIIAYAAYMENRFSSSNQYSPFGLRFKAARSFFSTTLPAHAGLQHAVLRVLNYEIAAVVQAHEAKQSAYALNDGITPLASAISLPAGAVANAGDCSDQDIQKLKPLLNISKARVFRDADHLTFIDGRRPRALPAEMADQFSPGERPRSIFAWLLGDILD